MADLYQVVHAHPDIAQRIDTAKRMRAVGIRTEYPVVDVSGAAGQEWTRRVQIIRDSGLKLALAINTHDRPGGTPLPLAGQLWLRQEAARLIGPDRLDFINANEPEPWKNEVMDPALVEWLQKAKADWETTLKPRGYKCFGATGESLDSNTSSIPLDIHRGLKYYEWIWDPAQQDYRWACYGLGQAIHIYASSKIDAPFWAKERAIATITRLKQLAQYDQTGISKSLFAITEFGARPDPSVNNYNRGTKQGKMAKLLCAIPGVKFAASYSAIGDASWPVDEDFIRGFNQGLA